MLKIGIVGGGIAGLYCALKLGTKHKVTVFETLAKPGGRIETLSLGGFNAECGPMRFELATQPLMGALIRYFKLKTGNFSSTSSGPSKRPAEFPKYLLNTREMSQDQLDRLPKDCLPEDWPPADAAMFSHHTTALQLLRYGIYRLLTQDLSKSLVQVVVEKDEEGKTAVQRLADSYKTTDDYDAIRARNRVDGRFLWELGFWNALACVLSPGALSKLKDMGTFYHLLPENPSASEWSIFWLRLSKSPPQCDLTTIESGVYSIIDRLECKLADMKNVEISPNSTVNEIGCDAIPRKLFLKADVDSRGRKLSEVFNGFDHIIFALPARPLQELMQPFPDRIQKALLAVIPFTLLKVFVVIRNPWWDKDKVPEAQEGASFLATREIHYQQFGEGANRQGMILLYMDWPAVSFWRSYIETPHTKAQRDRTPKLRQEIVRQLELIWPKKNKLADDKHRKMIDNNIITYAIRDWSHAPFMAACHAWSPRTEVPEALNSLKAFGLETSPHYENVHVCGEAYSDYQGFIEGSLRSAKSVIRSIRE